MHCLVCTDTDLYSLTKGKSYLAKQKWRRSTCLRDQCYDVGCHPCMCPVFTYCETSFETVFCGLIFWRCSCADLDWGNSGSGPSPPPGPDPLKNHYATKLAFNVGHYQHATETP